MDNTMFKRASAHFMAAAIVFAPLALARADETRANPATGEPETYVNVFTGADQADWNVADNWDTRAIPYIPGGAYSSALVDGKTVNCPAAIDGWSLRVGAYNGANIFWNAGISKIQAGNAFWLTADATSKITISSFAGAQLEGSASNPLKFTSAGPGGITWSTGLTTASLTTGPFHYYLCGSGTVVYGGDITVANDQVIKQADIEITGTKQIRSKTLVSFAGSANTKQFTADAAIKFVDAGGASLGREIVLKSVSRADAPSISTDNNPGTCELIQTASGVILYWVDGDISATPVYQPSISVNFTSGTALSTTVDVGIAPYAIPGTAWNNLIGNNGTLSTVTGVDATGTPSTISGASVTITGTRGYWTYGGVQAAGDLRQGYIDDEDANSAPTVTIAGIPYDNYKLVVYFSNDTDGRQLGHLTVNGTNYKWDATTGAIVECDGTSSDVWGSTSGASWTEGGNYLVFPAMINNSGTLTIVSHRVNSSIRAGVAAIQIVEVPAEIGENDLEIAVSGDTTYTISENKTYENVYITGTGTLTLDGTAQIAADTLSVGTYVTFNMDETRLSATTYTGGGTVISTGALPGAKGWTDSSAWAGTLWIKNTAVSALESNQYGNENSTIRFTGVTGYLQRTQGQSPYTHSVPVELVDDGDTVAFTYNDGWSGSAVYIDTIKGTGTFQTAGSVNGQIVYIANADGFTGNFNLSKQKVQIGGTAPNGNNQNWNGKLVVDGTATVSASATWTANGGFEINGTLYVNGTLASTASTAMSGSGLAVFTGRAPTPVDGDSDSKWWKNAGWTGTVQVKGVSGFTGTYLTFNNCGNAASTIELYNVSGYLPKAYTCIPKLKITGTLSLTDGHSSKTGEDFAFRVGTLLGSGTISGSGNAPTMVFNVTDDWSGFTGKIALQNKCVVFGETVPEAPVSATIYISDGAQVTVQNTASAAWWGAGGIKVDGELKANSLDRFGGGTNIKTSDTGVFTLVTDSNVRDENTDYTRIQGTGTLRYEGSAWRAISTNNFPVGMIVDNRLQMSGTDGGLLHIFPGVEATIGSLSGNGTMRSDYGNGNRNLRIVQSKDTEYSGLFDARGGYDRIGTVTIAPGAETAGTLTLSGTQTANNALAIEANAKVAVTGKWVGDTTAAGTISGTGEIAGGLVLTDGSTLLVSDPDELLSVTGNITATGTVTIQFPAGTNMGASHLAATATGTVDISGATFVVKAGDNTVSSLTVSGQDGGLKIVPNGIVIRIR